MRIGELARRSGVGVETVRFYEQKGLVDRPPRPESGGYRDYPAAVARRVSFIRSAQRLGFSLAEIADLLALETGEAASCADVRRRAETKRNEISSRIESLERIGKALDSLIDACPGEGPARDCSILGAINSGDLDLGPLTGGSIDERQDTDD